MRGIVWQLTSPLMQHVCTSVAETVLNEWLLSYGVLSDYEAGAGVFGR